MAQLSEDCFTFGRALMTLHDALRLLEQRLACVVGEEEAELRRCRGRVLAEDVSAAEDVPPHDNSAVDGYALRFEDLVPGAETRLRIAGRAAAGHPFDRTLGNGEAVRIFTGRADARRLRHRDDAGGLRGGGRVRRPAPGPEAGRQPPARRRGRAGGQHRSRARHAAAPARRGPRRLGWARPPAGYGGHCAPPCFSTGDELCEPGAPRPPGAIYDANRPVMIALLDALGCQVSDLGILEDDLEAIRAALAGAMGEHDLILTSGGMSVGEEDHVKAAVQSLGDLHFWQLAIKPGRPIGLGQVGGVPFIGLPGNPVAMMVTFLRIARPMILRLAGATTSPYLSFRSAPPSSTRKRPAGGNGYERGCSPATTAFRSLASSPAMAPASSARSWRATASSNCLKA